MGSEPAFTWSPYGSNMKGSVRIATVAGIGIFVHWTFLLLIAWLVGVHLIGSPTAAAGWAGAARELVFVLLIFVCIALHELGHALAAKRYGIATRDITLLPIGGIARLTRMPDRPWEEFVVAIAGPAVNVAIALVLGAVLLASTPFATLIPDGAAGAYWASQSLLARVALANVALVIFNLLPAFPMDGGRVLRAMLAAATDRDRATRIAAAVGQVMALVFAMGGVFLGQPLLFLVAIFVFFGAQAEAGEARARFAFAGLRVADAMITEFRSLGTGDTLQHAVDALLSSSQEDFPVVAPDSGRLAGVLTRSDLVRALAARPRETPIGEIMRRDCPIAAEGEPIEAAYRRAQESGCPFVPVLRAGVPVGLFTLENLTELVMVRQAAGTRRTA